MSEVSLYGRKYPGTYMCWGWTDSEVSISLRDELSGAYSSCPGGLRFRVHAPSGAVPVPLS